MNAAGLHCAARDLLLRRSPRITGHNGGSLLHKGELPLEAAKRMPITLDSSILPIQGPPGSGKTYTGARMICELVRRGKKVGITALSHKAIRNLLEEVVKAAPEMELPGLQCVQKVRDKSENASPSIHETKDDATV